ncbi:MAG: hypothetical protein Kow0068_21650 [Marinilabiliales bacterium]
MKALIFIICFTLIGFYLNAQKEIKVKETNTNIGGATNNALLVTIFEASEDMVKDAWKKQLKGYKAKVSDKKEIFADDALIKDISDNTIDIYSKTETDKDGNVLLYVAFDLGGAYISSSSHADKYKTAEKILREFALNISKEAVNEQIKNAEKELKKMEGELNQLVKEKEDLENKISGWEKDIENAKKAISDNEKKQEEQTKIIEEQKAELNLIMEKLKQIK